VFSLDQKKQIAAKVEEVILSFGHPEMPTEKPTFSLRIEGKDRWSWAEIVPNWKFTDVCKPGVNPHNEQQEERCKK